jgi:hypothetical protein
MGGKTKDNQYITHTITFIESLGNVMPLYLTNTMVKEYESSTLLILKPAIRHNSEPVQYSSDPHNLSP